MPDPEYDSKPTLSELQGWRDQLRSEWGSDALGAGTLDTQVENEEKTYFQRYAYLTPYGQPGVKTGSAPGDADAAMDSLRPVDPIQISVKPLRGRQKYEDQANLLKKAAAGILEIWSKQKDMDFWRDDQVLRRVGIARVMFDESLWPETPTELIDEPLKKPDESDTAYEGRWGDWDLQKISWEVRNRRLFPIVFERRDPRYTYWREYRGKLLVVVESYRTTSLEAFAAFSRYPEARRILKGRMGVNAQVLVDEIWYDRWRCILIDQMPILGGYGDIPASGEFEGIGEHGYPEIPYILAPWRELPYTEAGLRFRGMLSNSLDLYQRESEMMTMHMEMMRHNAWRTYVGHTRDGRKLTIVPGQYVDINTQAGEYLQILEGRPVPPEVMGTAKDFQQLIARNGAAQGPTTVEGTRSAQQVWAIENNRQQKLDTPRANLEKGVERALMLAFAMIEKIIGEPITIPVPGKDPKTGKDIGEVRLSPADIGGYWDGFRVKFRRRVDPAQIEQAKSFMLFANGKFMPKEVAQEMSGMTDFPQEWTDGLLDEAIESLPGMLEVAGAMRVAERFGEESWQFKTYMQVLQQSKQPGAPGEGSPANPGGQASAPSVKGPSNPPGPQGSTHSFGQSSGGGGIKPPAAGSRPGGA